MKFLVRKAPDNFIRTVNDEISSLLNRHFDTYFPQNMYFDDTEKLSMPIEVTDKGKDFEIKAELPGIKKENLDIDIENDFLNIKAKKIDETNEENENYKHSEFNYGEFSRTIQFPEEIDIDKTEAKLEDGVLKITAPKIYKEKEKTKKLLVK